MGWLKNIVFGKPKVMPVHVTDRNFKDEVTKSSLPVVLDIWSPGCAPCARLAPVMIELATRYNGQVRVAELNAAESPKTAAKLRVMGTPTVIYFKPKGRQADRVTGYRSSLYHTEAIEELLLEGAPESEEVAASATR